MIFSAFGVRLRLLWEHLVPEDLGLSVLEEQKEEESGSECNVTFSVSGSERSGFTLFRDKVKLGVASDREGCLDYLRGALPLAVAELSRDWTLVHSGAVAIGKCGILLPGHSGQGKSRLTWSLARNGAKLYSDEFAVLSPEGLLHTYPRWTQNRRKSGNFTGAELFPEPNPPVPVGLVLFLHFQPKEPVWNLRQLSAGQTCLKLLEHTPCARARPESVSVLGKVSEQAFGYTGLRGEAEAVCQKITELLRDRSLTEDSHR